MALSFTRLSWWWLGGKATDQVPTGSLINSTNLLGECGLGFRGEPESLKFYSNKRGDDKKISSWNSKTKRKWKSREDRRITRIDREHDVVLVPSDGVCLSGSESDESDWSIGWLEPHAPDFQCDHDVDDSFAVLVPCYRHDCHELGRSVELLSGVHNLPNGYSHVGDGVHGEVAFFSPKVLNFEAGYALATVVNYNRFLHLWMSKN
ncbi:hypothetical protein OROGR_006168 [Orobanche gracilis]